MVAMWKFYWPTYLVTMMSVMGEGGGAEKLRFKTYTLYFPSPNMWVPQNWEVLGIDEYFLSFALRDQ
jgi:hypothetical protein